jgi:hypothetical protein
MSAGVIISTLIPDGIAFPCEMALIAIDRPRFKILMNAKEVARKPSVRRKVYIFLVIVMLIMDYGLKHHLIAVLFSAVLCFSSASDVIYSRRMKEEERRDKSSREQQRVSRVNSSQSPVG